MRKILVIVVASLSIVACGGDVDVPATQDAARETLPAGAASSPDDIAAEGECQDATKAEGQADLEMQDFVFAPPCLVISKDQGLRVHNEGAVTHNWTVEGFEALDIDVNPGEENNTEATGLADGTYTFFCEYHRESKDMEGTLRVQDA